MSGEAPSDDETVGAVRDGVAASWIAGVAWLRLERPDRRNTIDQAAATRLTGLLQRADQDHRVRCIVLTGSGRDFCTGGDLAPAEAAVTREPDPWEPAGDAGAPAAEAVLLDYRWPLVPIQQLFRTLWELETPVVSAVNGTVAGIGWMLALLADFVVAAEGARWTHVFVRRGMMPHAGDTVFLPRVIPLQRLTELSDPVTSDVLGSWGLLHRVVAAGEVESVAGELAARLAAGPTLSLGQAKRMYRRSLLADVEGALAEERATTALVSATADRVEGTESFFAGRPPAFTGP
jgi:2-(1,2-epoxy-1,2-dihydrophenyl)acetyl-CoA isomerase